MPDLKSFAKYLKAYPRNQLRDIFIKHALSPFLGLMYKFQKIPRLVTLIRNILNEESFLLIVLDACRYDLFRLTYEKYFSGKLIPARSHFSGSRWLVPDVFSHPMFRNIRIFYSALSIRSHDVKLEKFASPDKNLEIIRIKPSKAKDLGVVLPSELNKEVLKIGLSKRNIVWYMQPHYPWIHFKLLSIKLRNAVMWQHFTPKNLIAEECKRNNIDKYEILKAYIANLETVLRSVSELLRENKDSFKGKIFITSDHGELLGEYGLFLHPPRYMLPQLCIVPWFEVGEVK